MYRFILSIVFFFSAIQLQAQVKDETAIRILLHEQTLAWNKGDIDGFMKGYWKSDSLMFIGKNGITYGWQQTMNNYKKNYPDTATMGQLAFEMIQIKRLSATYFYVVGKWTLTRSIGNVGGHYNLLLQRIKNRWVIIADHSS